MTTLNKMHLQKGAVMGNYNNKSVPEQYSSEKEEYRALRENIALTDYSHLSFIEVIGEDSWSLINHMVSADISVIREEQGIYTLILNDDGTIWCEAYILCVDDGYLVLSESATSDEIVQRLLSILGNNTTLDIQEAPNITIKDDKNWGAILLEGPYSWELLSEAYGFDIIGLPYNEHINTDDNLTIFRCGKHGEYAYLIFGEQNKLVDLWERLLKDGEKYRIKPCGLKLQNTLRTENPCWDNSIFEQYSKNPVELQMQWAIQYDKEDFIGKSAIEKISNNKIKQKLIGIIPTEQCELIENNDKILVNGEEVGFIVKAVYSPAIQNFIALSMIEEKYAYSDISGFTISTLKGCFDATTHNVPFIYNLSMLVNSTEHSYIDNSKSKSAVQL